jgi:group I intron endonuclease
VENCGVYAIINLVNNHRYIGSSCNVLRRWVRHQESLKKGNHHSRYLQRAWNFYGGENFKFLFLLQCDKNVRIEREQEWMDECRPEYNMAIHATGGAYPGVHKGVKRPDNIERNKTFRSRGHTGCLHSPETKKKMSDAWIERRKRGFSEETRRKISIASKKQVLSPEARAKISATLKEYWKKKKEESCQY